MSSSRTFAAATAPTHLNWWALWATAPILGGLVGFVLGWVEMALFMLFQTLGLGSSQALLPAMGWDVLNIASIVALTATLCIPLSRRIAARVLQPRPGTTVAALDHQALALQPSRTSVRRASGWGLVPLVPLAFACSLALLKLWAHSLDGPPHAVMAWSLSATGTQAQIASLCLTLCLAVWATLFRLPRSGPRLRVNTRGLTAQTSAQSRPIPARLEGDTIVCADTGAELGRVPADAVESVRAWATRLPNHGAPRHLDPELAAIRDRRRGRPTPQPHGRTRRRPGSRP